jgi:ATP-dependent DNA ligase
LDDRFPLVVEAVNHLKVRSCLIDGEVVCCDEKGVAAFHVIRHRRNDPQAFLYAPLTCWSWTGRTSA